MDLVFAYVAAGLAAGFLSGLLGIGGGLVLVPLFALLFSIQHVESALLMPLAMGTSLAAMLFTCVSSLRAHHARGAVDWSIVRRITPGIAIGSACGALLSSHMSGAALTCSFGIFAAVAATQMLFGYKAPATRRLPGMSGLSALGAMMGVVSGLIGVGAATLAVPYLTWRSVSVRNAIGSSSALALPIAFAGAAGYMATGWEHPDLPAFTIGFVHIPALVCVVAASVLAAPIGAVVSHHLPTTLLRGLFAVGLYGLAGKMLFGLVKL